MIKKKIRKEMIEHLKLLATNKSMKYQIDQNLLKKMLDTEEYKNAKVIATYLSMPNEFNTSIFIEKALRDNKKIVIPKTFSKGKMFFVEYDPNNLEKTTFGLYEPTSTKEFLKDHIDLIHVPGLAFNINGYRIGYGAGYYDRYLYHYTGDTISTLYPFQMTEFESEYFDVPVRKLII